jgi:UDP-glucose:(heptosyl)LPS alpha-1,3-glucosyltransferase
VKIALVILHGDPARGGAERYTIDIATALRGRAHAVTLIASSFAANLPSDVRQVPLALSAASKTRRYEEFLDQLDAHLAHEHYDVVHAMLPVRRCDVYHPHAGLAAAAVDKGHEKHTGTRRALAKIFNRFNPKRQRFAAIERELVEKAKPPLVICLSDYIRKEVQSYYALNESNLVTLFNAVDLKRFDPAARPDARNETRESLGLEPSSVAALIIAQDFERKGLREAIQATALVKNPRLKLIVIGKQDTTPYRQLADSLGAPVLFHGPTNDVHPFYAAADFFVLPTKHDPCSLVVLEALAMGLPVISTRQNGATEIMQNGIDGFVLDRPTDVDALAQAMRKLCDDATRDAMRASCLQTRGRLSFERHMDELINIYTRAQERNLRR